VLPVTRFAALPAFARQAEQSVTFPLGFRAAGVAAGIKRSNRLDVGLLVSDTPCAAATFFTRNEAAAAPVVVTRDSSACDRLRGVVVNSGNANACTGAPGLSDALRMRDLAAASLGLPTAEVGVCSTGVIGEPLPMQRVEQGVRMAAAKLSTGGGGRFAAAIRTTDSSAKHGALALAFPQGEVRLGFAAKGAGMICPDMATMLCFVTCDAVVPARAWRAMTAAAVASSFNRITVDGQESTNDTVIALANGASGVALDAASLAALQRVLETALLMLAVAIVADGEGATKVVRLDVAGARDPLEAERVARAVAGSPLVKAAFYGEDPNWGRVVQAAGQALAFSRSGDARPAPCAPGIAHRPVFAPGIPDRPVCAPDVARRPVLAPDVAYGPLMLVRHGVPLSLSEDERRRLVHLMGEQEIELRVGLGRGESSARLFFSDLTHQYVTLNAEYTT
jgi:glutamate N-acetyltransferase/amino-acid N-acetyltransferase